ncbi:MAG: hypothetical protein ACRCYY_04165 [Trueperaceae bacterium]
MRLHRVSVFRRVTYCVALLLLLVLVACSESQPTQTTAKETVVLSGATLSSLQAISEDGTLDFADSDPANSSEEAPFEVGQILAAGISEQTPDGLAPAEILAIEAQDDGGYQVKTQPIPLEKTVKEASVDQTEELTEEDVEALPEGMELRRDSRLLSSQAIDNNSCRKNGNKGFIVSANAKVPIGTKAEASVGGCVRFALSIKTKIEIDWFTLEEFEMGLQNSLETELSVDITGSLIGQALESKPILLGEVAFARRTVLVAGVPVVYKPVFKLYLTLDANLKATLSLSTSYQRESYLGTRYEKKQGRFVLVKTNQITSQPWQGKVSVGSEMGASVTLAFGIELYGKVATLTLEAVGRLYYEHKDKERPEMGLEGYVQGKVSVDIEVFGYDLLKTDATLRSNSEVIWKRNL